MNQNKFTENLYKDCILEESQYYIDQVDKKDLNQITEIEIECFSEPWSFSSIEEELKNSNTYFIVARLSGNILKYSPFYEKINQENELSEVIGYANMHIICDEGYINKIAVSSRYRNQKIGRALLKQLIAQAYNSNLDFVSLEVRESNFKAINLYKSEGFVNVGIRPGFYRLPKEDAVIMTLKIENSLKG